MNEWMNIWPIRSSNYHILMKYLLSVNERIKQIFAHLWSVGLCAKFVIQSYTVTPKVGDTNEIENHRSVFFMDFLFMISDTSPDYKTGLIFSLGAIEAE